MKTHLPTPLRSGVKLGNIGKVTLRREDYGREASFRNYCGFIGGAFLLLFQCSSGLFL
jgi:hypothetical protein